MNNKNIISNNLNKKIQKMKKHQKQKNDQNESKEQISIHKKIKDLNVFIHVDFDGEQDNYFIKKIFLVTKIVYLCQFYDVHGLNGHHTSNFIKTILPIDMSENLKHCNIITETEKIHEIVRETFIIANGKLVQNQEIYYIFSGTICFNVIFTPEKLIYLNFVDN